jgi:hypothetical protein
MSAAFMKTLIAFPVLLMFAMGAWAQQSLGDVARQARTQQKSSAIVRFDDDSLPHRVSITDDTKPTDDAKDDSKKEAGDNGKTPDGKDQDKKDVKNEKTKAQEWTAKVDDEKKEIVTLQRELDILQREQRLRAASFYADAGTRLRDSGKFAEDSRQEQDQIDGKKQALDAAQQKLSDIQEQSRKAGVPPQ